MSSKRNAGRMWMHFASVLFSLRLCIKFFAVRILLGERRNIHEERRRKGFFE